MNIVALTRFIGNLAIAVGFTAILFVVMPLFPQVSGTTWAVLLFGIAALGILAQFAAAMLRPKDAKAAWDEQSAASNRASYVFGYWCVMLVFLIFLAAVLADALSAEAAFLWMSFPLALGPTTYMVWAFLKGRAG